MRVLVCGDRNWTNKQMIYDALSSLPVKFVIEGEARGADRLAYEVAKELHIDIGRYFANWGEYGLAGGPIRNTQMLKLGKPDLVLAFHNQIEESKGTADMLCKTEGAGLPYCLFEEQLLKEEVE